MAGLTADTEYSIHIFATNPQGRYDQAAGNYIIPVRPLSGNINNTITGSTVSARTSHDMTMVVVGIILIVFLVVIYVFLRRHGLPQVMIKSTNMNLVLIS